jgi:hypothetical protein
LLSQMLLEVVNTSADKAEEESDEREDSINAY